MQDYFLEEFIIPISDIRAYKQLGNSVTFYVIKAVFNCNLREMDYMKKERQG